VVLHSVVWWQRFYEEGGELKEVTIDQKGPGENKENNNLKEDFRPD